jgi:hypothetical protein
MLPDSIQIPGPSTTTTISTTTTLAPLATFSFDATTFVDRWNSVAASIDDLPAAAYHTTSATAARFQINVPEFSVDWDVSILVEPLTNKATAVIFVGPLQDDSFGANVLGALLVISAVEGYREVTEAVPLWNELEAQMAAQNTQSVTVDTAEATFRLSVSRETLFFLEATP